MAKLMLILLELNMIRSALSASNLSWMSFYDFDPNNQHGWSYGVSSSIYDIQQAYNKYRMQSMFHLPDVGGNISDCSTSKYYPIFYRSPTAGVCPKWSSNLNYWISQIEPFIDNKTINGYFIGDELCCHGLNYTYFKSIVTSIRESIGNKPIIMANECVGTFNSNHNYKWTEIPDGLNYISADYYDMGNGTNEYIFIKNLYQKYIFPLLKTAENNKYGFDQKCVFVPGVFACNSSINEMNINSENIIITLNDMFEWGKSEDRIAGFNPWHFDNRSNNAGPSKFVPQGCMTGVDTLAPGAISMPNVVQKLKEIGQYILG